MRLIFVMDIMNGIAVLAERGERQKYRKLSERSLIVKSSDPIEVLEVIRPRFLYVADLDRILGKGDNLDLLNSLSLRVEEMIADCGFRSPNEIKELNFVPVLGTETFDLTKLYEVERDCYVSIDFIERQIIDSSGKFMDLESLLEFLNSFSLRGVIVLNLKRIGSGNPDFELLSRVLTASENPVYMGGGIGRFEDLVKLKEIGCKGVLISSAIHRKTISVEFIRKGFV
ncbi:MAG: HisA/HisF family protein [Archaeoglobaceae archaeon]|nr:HisA/HisF family protein [Archaeoglobaceae archaeon]